jgi:hypothetical protein
MTDCSTATLNRMHVAQTVPSHLVEIPSQTALKTAMREALIQWPAIWTAQSLSVVTVTSTFSLERCAITE